MKDDIAKNVEDYNEMRQQYNTDCILGWLARDLKENVKALVIHLPNPIVTDDSFSVTITVEDRTYRYMGSDRENQCVHYSCETEEEAKVRQEKNLQYTVAACVRAFSTNQPKIMVRVPGPMISKDRLHQFIGVSKDKAYRLISHDWEKRVLEYVECPRNEMNTALPLLKNGVQIADHSDPETIDDKIKEFNHDRKCQKSNAEYIATYLVNMFNISRAPTVTIKLPNLMQKTDGKIRFVELRGTGLAYALDNISQQYNTVTYKLVSSISLNKQNINIIDEKKLGEYLGTDTSEEKKNGGAP